MGRSTTIKKTTIVDIAEAAGVSVSTVSRILNNKPDVAEETRQRVLQVIEEQRFAPQITWQQLRSGKSRFIALHFPQDFNPPSQEIITSAALCCRKRWLFPQPDRQFAQRERSACDLSQRAGRRHDADGDPDPRLAGRACCASRHSLCPDRSLRRYDRLSAMSISTSALGSSMPFATWSNWGIARSASLPWRRSCSRKSMGTQPGRAKATRQPASNSGCQTSGVPPISQRRASPWWS